MVHPLDPLSAAEIPQVAKIVSAYLKSKGDKTVIFNTITLLEPPKAKLQKFVTGKGPKPARKAEAIVIGVGTGQVSEVIVSLETGRVEEWINVSGVQPTITLEDLNSTEDIIRKDPGVIEQCRISGVTDMSKVYCDPWTIGYDERWHVR